MSKLMVYVTEIRETSMSDVVALLCKNRDLENNVDDMAEQLCTISYELLCNISIRLQQFYF